MGLLVHHYCHIHRHYYYYYGIIGRLRWCHHFASPTNSKYLIYTNIFHLSMFSVQKSGRGVNQGLVSAQKAECQFLVTMQNFEVRFLSNAFVTF